jgi:hypothetical protein
MCFPSVSVAYILPINVYMPYEDDESRSDEFINVVSVVEELIDNNSDYHINH